MAATLATLAKNGLLDAMLRASASATYTVGQYLLADAPGTSLIKYKTLAGAGAEFNTPSGGAATLVSALSTSHSSNGTIASAGLRDTGGANDVVTPYTMSCGLSGGLKDVVVDDVEITAAEACNITDGAIGIQKANGACALNMALRNRIISYFVRKNTAVFSAAGAIKVYSGVAPDVDAAASGTLLLSFTTSTTSWNAAASGAAALAATLSATAGATNTAGYARFEWTSGGQDYWVQGSVGVAASGANFILSSLTIVSGNSFDCTEATFAYP
jgi:hypothetical protein